MKKLTIIKLCNTCKKTHSQLPLKYKVWVDDEMILSGSEPQIIGYHFDCECGSSMFVKASLVQGESA